jgi:hypothetical protein
MEMAANLTVGKTLLIFVTTSTCCPIACTEFLETLSESFISFCYSLNVSIDLLQHATFPSRSTVFLPLRRQDPCKMFLRIQTTEGFLNKKLCVAKIV